MIEFAIVISTLLIILSLWGMYKGWQAREVELMSPFFFTLIGTVLYLTIAVVANEILQGKL